MDAPPDDLISLRAALAQAQAKALAAEQLAAAAQAKLAAVETDTQAQIAALKLLIEKLQRELYGQPPKEPCAGWLWAAAHGCSPAVTAVANAPRSCTA